MTLKDVTSVIHDLIVPNQDNDRGSGVKGVEYPQGQQQCIWIHLLRYLYELYLYLYELYLYKADPDSV